MDDEEILSEPDLILGAFKDTGTLLDTQMERVSGIRREGDSQSLASKMEGPCGKDLNVAFISCGGSLVLISRDTGSWVPHHKELNSAHHPNEPGRGEEGKMTVQTATR